MKLASVSALLALVVSAGVALGNDAAVDPLDWPFWRGPEMNGISREVGLVDRWSPEGENLLWKRGDLGTRSTPIVLRGKLYLLCRDQPGTRREAEKVVCLDAQTGKTLWENRFNIFLSDVPAERVAWSSVVGDPETGNVYALGVCGYFQAIDGQSGKTLWDRSLSEEYGLLSTYGGRTNFPVVFEDLVIISGVMIGWAETTRPQHRFIAFDKRTGTPVWFTGTRPLPYDTTYSSPTLTVLGGQAAMVVGTGDGDVVALQPRTGQAIWNYRLARHGINTSPLVADGMVYVGQSEENIDDNTMGALAALDGSKTGDITGSGERWRVKQWMVGKSSPILVDGRLYAIDDGAKLLVVDPKTGKSLLRRPVALRSTMQRGSPLYAEGRIYTCTANGVWHVLEPTADGVRNTDMVRLPGEVHASPIVSHGRIYLATTEALYCIGKAGQVPKATPRPAPPTELAEADPKPALLQLIPVEALVRPGEELRFETRLFNSRGQRLGPQKAEFTIKTGPATIEPGGRFVARKDASHEAAYVIAKVGNLEAQARVRIVPPLPWSFDFASGQIPITFVGIRYRHLGLDLALLESLEKAQPLAAQAYIYLMTGFVNGRTPKLEYDDAGTARGSWTALAKFLNLPGAGKDPGQSRTALDPALDLLQKEGVIGSREWSQSGSGGIRLVVQAGPRKIEKDGGIVKITTIPLGTKSQGWMGQPDLHDYTIEADVKGATKEGKVPDIGVVGQRYSLVMLGASQQLQIRTWPPQLRMAKTIDFAWKPDVWYTMKLRAANEGDLAVLRGKVWERGKPEPREWMVVTTDESPNRIGSPGLFGNARDAELYYDRITVRPNEDVEGKTNQ